MMVKNIRNATGKSRTRNYLRELEIVSLALIFSREIEFLQNNIRISSNIGISNLNQYRNPQHGEKQKGLLDMYPYIYKFSSKIINIADIPPNF